MKRIVFCILFLWPLLAMASEGYDTILNREKMHEPYWGEFSFLEKASFDHEPPIKSGEILRYQIILSEPSDKMLNVIWTPKLNTLYVDLDGDGDFLNDGESGKVGVSRGRNYIAEYQVEYVIDGKKYLLAIDLSECVSDDHDMVNPNAKAWIGIVYGYTGKIDIEGSSWEFSYIDAPDDMLPLRDMVSIRNPKYTALGRAGMSLKYRNFRGMAGIRMPMMGGGMGMGMGMGISSRSRPEVQYEAGNYYKSDIELFIDTKNYCLDFVDSMNNSDTIQLKVKEKPIETGILNLKDRKIGKLMLIQGDNKLPDRLIWPKLNDDCIVPAGMLSCITFELCSSTGKVVRPSRDFTVGGLNVAAGQVTEFKAGAPLRSTVDIRKKGRLYDFDYKLVGAGGEEYRLSGLTGERIRPGFEIYRGSSKVASGSFEYG